MKKLIRYFISGAIPAMIALSAFVSAPSANAAFQNLYSYIKVKTDNPDGGLVCVVKGGQNASTYKEEDTLEQKTFAFGSSSTHNYTLYAQPKEGYVFTGWYENNKVMSTESPFTRGVVTYTTTSPGTGSTYTAHFIPKPAATATTSIPYGAPTVTPEVNKVGDEITLSYTLPGLPKYQYAKNVMLEFSHWEDEDGNVLSHENTFSTVVEHDGARYVAVLKELGELPQVGKYYRVRTFSGRVLTIEGGYSFSFPLAGGATVDPTRLRWVKPTDYNPDDFKGVTEYPRTDSIRPILPESSPATIFFLVSGNISSDKTKLTKTVLSGQGVDTKTLCSGNTLDFVPMNHNFYGYYGFQSSAISKAGLKMTYNNTGCDVYLGTFGEEDPYCAMAVQPIDEEHMDHFWFGAAPDENMQFDGAYWASMYTAFPYECRDGVEAYYVTASAMANGETFALLTRIDGDIVPAKTAVLLKCNSLNSKENRLLPLHPDTQVAPVEGNMLKGEFQLNTNNKGEGKIKFNPETMRVFGANRDGVPGFYRLVKNSAGGEIELAANKAYLDLTAFSADMQPTSIKLMYDTDLSGVESVNPDNDTDTRADDTIYNLYGQPVAHPVKGQLYIMKGKKVIY